MTAERLLIDTSAWISGFRKSGSADLKELLRAAILSGRAVICPPVILELVQGCRHEEERSALRSRLESLQVLPLTDAAWERAYELGFALRRKGVTAPTLDIMISAVALENDCTVAHSDHHFEVIRSHSDLKTKSFLPQAGPSK